MGCINRIGRLVGGEFEVQVNATANDGYWYSGAFDNSSEYLMFGYGNLVGVVNTFARWAGFVIPAGAKIKSAYISVYVVAFNGTLNGNRIYFNDAAAPTAPTNESTANGKTKTSAYVAFDPSGATGWKTSGDISAIVQELVDSYGTLTSAMMILGVSSTTNTYADLYSYNRAGNTYGPKLYVKW